MGICITSLNGATFLEFPGKKKNNSSNTKRRMKVKLKNKNII